MAVQRIIILRTGISSVRQLDEMNASNPNKLGLLASLIFFEYTVMRLHRSLLKVQTPSDAIPICKRTEERTPEGIL